MPRYIFAGGAFRLVPDEVAPGESSDQLHFETRFNAEVSTQYESNAEVIAGLAAPSESAVANGEQSLNGAAFTSANVTVNNGDTLKLRRTSSASAATQASATATIGSMVATFAIVTAAAEVVRTSWRRRAVLGFKRRVA